MTLAPYYVDDMVTLYNGDCREILAALDPGSVQTCVTSPPYFGLRDYGHAGQIGLERTPDEYVAQMVAVFREVRRVLRDDGTLWLNLGDTYAGSGRGGDGGTFSTIGGTARRAANTRGHGDDRTYGFKAKDLIGIPWRVAFALQADGWYLRSDIIWHKPNPMPESVTDRPTKAHEYLFLLAKSERYYYNADAIKEDCARPGWADETRTTPGNPDRNDGGGVTRRPSVPRGGFNGKTEAMADEGRNAFRVVVEKRNRRSVWTVATRAYAGAHFATFPPDLITPCILAGAPIGGVVLDPFGGSGTTGAVAKGLGRRCVLVEINQDYCPLAVERWPQHVLALGGDG